MRPSASSIFCSTSAVTDDLGRLAADGLLLAVHHPGELGEGGERHLAEGHAAIFLVLGLQRPGEVLVALVGHDVELVDRFVEDALRRSGPPAGASRGRSPAASSSALLRLVERADLEDVRVVPAFAQGRVAEDEAQRLVHRQQPLLVLHDQVVDLVVGLGVAPRVLEHAFLVLGEVAVVQLVHRQLEPFQRVHSGSSLANSASSASKASANLPFTGWPDSS